MKKVIVVLVLLIIMVFKIAFASSEDIIIKVNGDIVKFPDAQPFINDNGRTLVPVRFVSEKLGANVLWRGDTSLVIVKKDNKRILLRVNENWAIVNIMGQTDFKKDLDTKIIEMNNRVFVPLRFVSEVLECNVEWDNVSRTVNIYSQNSNIGN